ncbi:MAG: 1-deoxy-D-xylulose-5-phosphate synthase [Desulfurella sp.]|uniref:1-deoxy-D-xylulose-5-phosphate synthase n=1 Tax=Desulfurella sp. TaxID=1962857 RepID=UPI000CA7276D|nr:1-deoxy-D-xylulose-5-phosphate synthase [Desulfurella sp.]PMP88265.1 MAG: 1-deoxy-D-xylulose-5-phosphate synthase [Desulfurella sp.]HEX12977.1 1-deoxy-D-xylulose-5-phosphate synthase [Desulfurella acetivorans]
MIETINSPSDLKKLKLKDLSNLANEIRQLIIETVSKNGGHLASSLGAVELTLALHYVFNTPKDKIVWDVGHQTYAHKIITGRRDQFKTLRTYGGISGFPKITESEYDTFNVGHASTAISAALGMTTAKDLLNTKEKIIAVIGDGALTSGITFEALNNSGELDKDLIVVLNDNKMSISKSLGAISTYLTKRLTGPTYNTLRKEIEKAIKGFPVLNEPALKLAKKIEESFKFFSPGLLFEEFGFKYFGPVDGENIEDLVTIFENVKNLRGPIFVHILTKKGKGYKYAEENPSKFHGIGPFDISTGQILEKSATQSYSSVFGESVINIMQDNPKVVAISAAMLIGTGLEKAKNIFPDRVFDVGIAEQHAVTFAGGLAISGMKPIVAIYSTFLQRSYDQIIHDIALQKLNVVFAIDRAGIVGDDGETHQGIFDVSYLNLVPNMIITAPKDATELDALLKFAINGNFGPFAIRYPRGESVNFGDGFIDTIEFGKWQVLNASDANDICIIAYGNCIKYAMQALEELKSNGINPHIINARFIKPFDTKMFSDILNTFNNIIIMEENTYIGSLGQTLIYHAYLNSNGKYPKIKHIALPDAFIEQGDSEFLRHKYFLSKDNLIEKIYNLLKK